VKKLAKKRYRYKELVDAEGKPYKVIVGVEEDGEELKEIVDVKADDSGKEVKVLING
jgi:hypothetical protein